MANTANYDWPLPSPSGIQITEVAKIATSLIAIDAKLKSTETALSTHKHKFVDLLERPTTLGGYGITDGMTATEVAAAIQQAISDLVNGSGAALDTLKELADALGNDPEFATTVGNALGLRVRVDAAQAFSLAQKTQGRLNLDALGTVDKGKADGVASLDSTGKVPAGQLPAMNYLPLAGGVLSGNLEIKNSGNKVLRFLRANGTRAAAVYALADATPGFNITVDNADSSSSKTFVFGAAGDLTVPGSVSLPAGAGVWIGTSGRVADDGNLWGTRWGTNGAWLYDYLNTRNTKLSARAYPRRDDGQDINFLGGAAQGGYPPAIIGGGWDGNFSNFYFYSTSNLNVGQVGGWNLDTIRGEINWRVADTRFAGYIEQPMGGGVVNNWYQFSSGYVATGYRYNANNVCSGLITRQLQIYIPNVGWRSFGGW